MKDRLQRWWLHNHPYLLVCLICFLALWPFISNPSLPNDTDAELHVYRLAELSRLVRGGEFYPRWASNFYFGYGYPIFNYYAPFSYYVGLAFDLLPAINPVTATKIVFMSAIVLGGLGSFGYARLLFGERAGYVATAVFVYSPYIQYIDPHARGVSPESFALGLFPIVMWQLERLRREQSGRNFLVAGLAVTALCLTHNIMTMVFGGMLLIWCLWQCFGKANVIQAKLSVLIAYGLGIIGSSFFWIPVALERNEVNLGTLIGPEGSHFSFTSHFLSLSTLLAPTRWLDWGATEPYYIFNLGVAPWLLGFSGIGFGVWHLTRQRNSGEQAELWQIGFWAISAVGLIWLMLPSSEFLWRTIPVLPFIQFPWRLLGPMAAVLAILAGFATRQIAQYWPTYTKHQVPIALGFTMLLAAPLTQVQPWAEAFGDTDLSAVVAQENQGRWLGTTSTADFVPATVDVIPSPQPQLFNALLNNQTPDRVNYASLPGDVNVEQDEIRPLHTRYTVTSQDPFAQRLFLFQYPGWEVRIDGQIAETEVGLPEGFIVIPTPAGTHTIDVQFTDTPARTWGWIFSVAALVTLICGAIWLSTQPSTKESSNKPVHTANPISWASIAGLTILIISSGSWLHYDSTNTAVEGAQQPLQENFGDQIMLVGADISSETAVAGDTLFVTYYWRAATDLDINYQVFVHLFAPDGSLVAQSDKLNPGAFPTTRWSQDKYVRDAHQIALPAQLAPGEYTVKVGLWVQTEGWRLPLLNENGEQIDDGFPTFVANIRDN